MKRQQQFSRRSFLKTLGTAAFAAPFITRNLMAQSPNGVVRHASFGTGGQAWSDLTQLSNVPRFKVVAVCDVDLDRTTEARKKFPDARVYQDWRELLAKEAKHIDSVNVSVPDHMHAPIAVSAMRLGKNVYGQKPLAHDLYEVRRMTEVARREKVVTQMGIQIHSSKVYRTGVQIIRNGTIGKIKEVHSWCSKSWGDPSPKPERADPVPPNLNWDLWLGVCAERPFIGDKYYHPMNWRKRLDFGTGTFGDMGCHIFDPVFKSLELTAPISVRSEGAAPNEWNWALDSKIHYTFPGTKFTAGTTLPVTWYDGTSRPPVEIIKLMESDELPAIGSMFIGTEGVMVLPHIARAQLYPNAKFENFKYPEVAEVSHWASYIDACLGEGKTSANFDYAGPLTEAVLLGGVATHFPLTTLEWDAHKLKFSLAEANHFVRRSYRKGWHVRGL
ncbi:MAG TPA: Gfo/Idh/MocA family oxidoreductase [Verrucomicrobiae bacterium]|nr:Gfo/Idh/MocA family oxidoreductase [Verrucomicrobiae bacterium]